MSAIHQVVDRFIASYCQSLFEQDANKVLSDAHTIPPASVRMIHKVAISTVDVKSYLTQNEHRRDSYECPSLDQSVASLRRKLQLNPNACESGLRAMETVLEAKIPINKPELFRLIDMITETRPSGSSSTDEERRPRGVTSTGPDILSTMTGATANGSDEGGDTGWQQGSSDWPDAIKRFERSRTSSFGPTHETTYLRPSILDAPTPPPAPRQKEYPVTEPNPAPHGPSGAKHADGMPWEAGEVAKPGGNFLRVPRPDEVDVDSPEGWQGATGPSRSGQRGRGHTRPSPLEDVDSETFSETVPHQQTEQSRHLRRRASDSRALLLDNDDDSISDRPPRRKPRPHESNDMGPFRDREDLPLSYTPASQPQFRSEGSSSWKPKETGSLASLHRQLSGRHPSRPPHSPSASIASNEWRQAPSSTEALQERTRRARSKFTAAMSIYPSPSDSIALVRDVIFCLQGVDGQHIQFVPSLERFLLRRDIPVARPIRILTSRMVASGNLFMQIHRALSLNFAELLSFGGGDDKNRITLPSEISFCWRTPGGVATRPDASESALAEEQPSQSYDCTRPPLMPCNSARHRPSLVVLAFLQAVKDELSAFYKDLGTMENDLALLESDQHLEHILENMPAPRIAFSSTTLRKLLVRLRPVLKRIHGIAWLVDITAGEIGGELLSTLNDAKKSGDPNQGMLAERLLSKAAHPMLEWMRDWILAGKLSRDVHKEFFITCKEGSDDPTSKGFYSCWRDNISVDWEMTPLFFDSQFIQHFYSVGKMAYFIKLVKGPSFFEVPAQPLVVEPASSMVATSSAPLITIQQVPLLVAGALEDAHRLGGLLQSAEHGPLPTLASSSQDMSIEEVGLSQPPTAMSGRIDAGQWPSDLYERFMEQLLEAEKAHRKDMYNILFVEHHFVDHLIGIKNFLLLGAGDFAEALLDQTSDLLVQRGCVQAIVQSEIDMCVLKAIESSIVARLPQRILDSVKALRMSEEERFGRSSWDYFALDYQLQGAPISVILRDELITQYRRIFAFLWKVRRTVKHQHTLWFTTVSNAFLLHFPQVSEVLLQCQSLRCEVLHLLQSLESFFFTDIIQPAFEVMISQVQNNEWSSLDDLISIQESFIQTLLYGTFLDEWPHPNTFKTIAVETTTPVPLNVLNVKSRQGTLPDIHSLFLSSSCALPNYTEKMISAALSKKGGPKLIDDLLETSWSFALFMDTIQTSAFEIISESFNQEPETFEETLVDQEIASAAFADQYGPCLNELRFAFTQQLYDLLDFLHTMKSKYRSEAVSALLTRLDLNAFYDRLRALEASTQAV